MIISEKLLEGYNLSLVIPISQFGILLASAWVSSSRTLIPMVPTGRYPYCLPWASFVLSFSAAKQHVSLRMFSEFWEIPGKL